MLAVSLGRDRRLSYSVRYLCLLTYEECLGDYQGWLLLRLSSVLGKGVLSFIPFFIECSNEMGINCVGRSLAYSS